MWAWTGRSPRLLMPEADARELGKNGNNWSTAAVRSALRMLGALPFHIIGHHGQWRTIMGTSEFDLGACLSSSSSSLAQAATIRQPIL